MALFGYIDVKNVDVQKRIKIISDRFILKVIDFMRISECGTRADKTRIELCQLLRTLCEQLNELTETISDIERTLYNEEYE